MRKDAERGKILNWGLKVYPAPGEVKQNELDCGDTAPSTYLLFKETYGNDVYKLIKSLNSSTGCDLDGISRKLL